jgi:hypothetical protein
MIINFLSSDEQCSVLYAADKRYHSILILKVMREGGCSYGDVEQGDKNWPIPWSLIVLEKLVFARLANKIVAGYGFHFQHRNPRTLQIEIFAHDVGTCRIRLSEGISKHQQLKKKSAATALNTVLTSAHTQTACEPHGATRQQAIAKTPAKWSAYQIPSVTCSSDS